MTVAPTPAVFWWLRVLGVVCVLMGVPAVLAGLLLLPPILERFILVDGSIETLRARLVFYAATVALILLAGLLFAAARRLLGRAVGLDPRRIAFSLVAGGLSAALLLATGEIAVRATIPPEQYLIGDTFWQYRWAAGDRAGDYEARNVLRAAVDQFDPQLGWVPAPGYRSDGLNVNSAGLRGLREYEPNKPAGVKRIVVIGDSFTFGEDVRDEEVYPARLEELLDGMEVLNLGVRGYGTDQQVLRMQLTGFAHQPDLVILGVYTLNIERNVLSFRDYAKPVFRFRKGRLQCENVPIPHPNEAGDRFAPRMPLCGLFAVARKGVDDFLSRTWLDPKWAISAHILEELHRQVQQHGTRLLIVHIPANRGVRDTAIFLKDWTSRNHVPYLDLYDIFDVMTAVDRTRLYAGHWTPFGHEVAAEAIRHKIVADRLLPER